jgi:ATP-dependent Zn protease
LVNQAALKAAIEGKDFVSMKHMYFARDKVIMGKNGHYVSVPSQILDL